MSETRNKVKPSWRYTPTAVAMAEQMAGDAGLPVNVWLEGLIRRENERQLDILMARAALKEGGPILWEDLKQQLADDAKAQAMFAERNEYDR